MNRHRFLCNFGVGGLLPYTYNPATQPDGSLPATFSGGAFTVSSGVIVNTPTEAANQLVDGDMEAVGVASWPNYNTPVTKEKNSTNPLSGLQDLHVVTDAALRGASQNKSLTPGWYAFKSEHRVVSGTVNITAGVGSFQFYTQSAGNQAVKTSSRVAFLVTATATHTVWLAANAAGEFYFDNIGLYPLTEIRTLMNAGRADVTVISDDCIVTGSSPTANSIGVSLNWDAGGLNGVDCYIARIPGSRRLVLVKWLNGSPAVVTSQVITYSDGAPVKVVKTGTTYGCYYNNALITEQTISDAAIISNTRHGLFNTGGGSSQGAFFCSAN